MLLELYLILREGQNVKLTGEYWKVHKQFGNQFNIQDYEEITTKFIDGIEKYLTSGVIAWYWTCYSKK